MSEKEFLFIDDADIDFVGSGTIFNADSGDDANQREDYRIVLLLIRHPLFSSQLFKEIEDSVEYNALFNPLIPTSLSQHVNDFAVNNNHHLLDIIYNKPSLPELASLYIDNINAIGVQEIQKWVLSPEYTNFCSSKAMHNCINSLEMNDFLSLDELKTFFSHALSSIPTEVIENFPFQRLTTIFGEAYSPILTRIEEIVLKSRHGNEDGSLVSI